MNHQGVLSRQGFAVRFLFDGPSFVKEVDDSRNAPIDADGLQGVFVQRIEVNL